MWVILIFACIVLFGSMIRVGVMGDVFSDSDDRLEASFITQDVVLGDRVIRASTMDVLHRWHTHVLGNNRGGVAEMDANWLCRTRDGQYVIAMAIGASAMFRERATVDWQGKVEIRWTWRPLTEERARQLLAATPSVYRKVFGEAPARRY
ncbi:MULTISPECIES: hypothetical protein [Dyella]|uniref:Uncharacterized protein n=2 Tax=Dyella TaxID=231454 RepID=A0A4R0YRQ4_9GAMM|nr:MULTISPECIES: hypothetical protein [Dyella]TBR40546.1 hypothetical protein EYV96_10455 [Dyella terrae]TCI11872.1 hypothetical protein EZM97_00415 [Dyella soli]